MFSDDTLPAFENIKKTILSIWKYINIGLHNLNKELYKILS